MEYVWTFVLTPQHNTTLLHRGIIIIIYYWDIFKVEGEKI